MAPSSRMSLLWYVVLGLASLKVAVTSEMQQKPDFLLSALDHELDDTSNQLSEYIVELRTGVSVQNFSNTFGLQYISPIFGQEYHRVKMAPTMSRKRAAEVAQLAFRPSEGIVWWEPVKYVKYKKYASVEADPAMKAQWHLATIKANEVHATGVFGKNINIRINDDGVFSDTQEIEVDLNLSFNYVLGENDPSPPAVPECFSRGGIYCAHGTFCASLAASRRNGNCGVGVAPDASVSATAIIGYPQSTTANIAEALGISSVDISSNSWGSSGCAIRPNPFNSSSKAIPYCLSLGVSEIESKAIDRATSLGREGKGTIVIFASGNDGDVGDDTNYQEFGRRRDAIFVGASQLDDTIASYSVGGAGLLVVAPGGDSGVASSSTVDVRNGILSFVKGFFSGRNASELCAYFGAGTSWSAPIVAGSVALILETRPDLTWRDVQAVLVNSADKIDPTNPSWKRNSAGHLFSHSYGFGRVNVLAAVELARVWKLLPKEMYSLQEGSFDLIVPADSSKTATSPIVVAKGNAVTNVESVGIQLLIQFDDASTINAGIYEIAIVSPGGTRSVLNKPRPLVVTPSSQQLRDTVFLTRAMYGENPEGTWNLQIQCNLTSVLNLCVLRANSTGVDPAICSTASMKSCGVLRQWKLFLHGYSSASSDPGAAPSQTTKGFNAPGSHELPTTQPQLAPVVNVNNAPERIEPHTKEAVPTRSPGTSDANRSRPEPSSSQIPGVWRHLVIGLLTSVCMHVL